MARRIGYQAIWKSVQYGQKRYGISRLQVWRYSKYWKTAWATLSIKGTSNKIKIKTRTAEKGDLSWKIK